MFQTEVFYASVDAAGAYTQIAPVTSQTGVARGNDMQVPVGLPYVVALAGGLGSGGNGLFRLESPSLLARSRYYGEPIMGNTDGHILPTSPHITLDMRSAPMKLTERELLDCYIHSNTTAAARQWVIVTFADGAITAAPSTPITVRLTGSTTVTAAAWSTCTLTLDTGLPVGQYQIVGARVRSANGIAARFILQGQANRPGLTCVTAVTDIQSSFYRYGGLGVWGTFDLDTLPILEIFCGAADTAQIVDLDVVPV